MSPTPPPERPAEPDRREIAAQARRIARLALKAAMATRDAVSGDPFISMGAAATAMDGAPVLLMSALARHRRNLDRHPEASLLFETGEDRANPLTGARISISGRVEPLADEIDQARFLARQPKAFYAGFSDFQFYKLQVRDVHFVGGFGIAMNLAPADYLLETGRLGALRQAEGELIARLTRDHKAVLHNIVKKRLNGPKGAWRLTGIDPEGCDFKWKHRVRR